MEKYIPPPKASAVSYGLIRPGRKNPDWRNSCEDNLCLVLEANRRFLAETQDQRRADLLTLSWAMLTGGE